MCARDYNKLITIPTKGAIEINANILNFGAACDGKTLCTAAIQAAIDACAASGGGTVTVPCGKFITGTLWMRDNVELFLSHGAILKASNDLDDYNAEDAYEQNFSSRANEKWLGKHMIIAHECENVAVCGTGMLDGNGDHFLGEALPYSAYVWSEGCRTARDPELCRPGQLLCFIECRHVKVRDITITNQPCWGCFLHGCEYVSIRGLKTLNPHANFNSDGIDIDCCSFVTISDCIIDTGDDCIAIRGAEARLKNKPHPCEHITISNCVLGSSSCSFRTRLPEPEMGARSAGMGGSFFLALPLRSTAISALANQVMVSGESSIRTFTRWRSRSTSVTVPRPSGVSTKDSALGLVRSRSS